jgi:hypothetical protein
MLRWRSTVSFFRWLQLLLVLLFLFLLLVVLLLRDIV